jgi:uncharacterized membrane protein (UPF0127 family)
MPSNVTAKTASAPKRLEIVLLSAALGIVICVGIIWQTSKPAERTLQVGRQAYGLEVAKTDKEHERGLSGRTSLAPNKGMIFVFSREEEQCFWMKDMHFPLDMIWLDAKHKVVFLQQKATPDSYPRTFCSSHPAAYVIELNAGEIQRLGIRNGQLLSF